MTTEQPAPTLCALEEAWTALSGTTLRAMFAADPLRFEHLSAADGDLLLDFSKCRMTPSVVDLLVAHAEEAGVPARRDAMFAGAKINATENRAVLHTALRKLTPGSIIVDGADVMPDVRRVREACLDYAEAVRVGRIAGLDGRAFTDVVNIGIGGSDLGPAMAVEALHGFHRGPNLHFVSNVDGAHLADTLSGLDAATTLFIIASKTFTTIETMTNARSARAWLVDKLGEKAVGTHFVAVSTALPRVAAFGIAEDRTFGFWDWVGGRYSIWSAIGLPLMIAIGRRNFLDFLAGGEEIDLHFRETPLRRNLPVLMGLIGFWHRTVCGYASRAIIPYAQRLHRFPAYLQQLDMESNGKSVRLDGSPVSGSTGCALWGEPGTNGQHAFFQLLHQGTDIIPVEFLLAAEGDAPKLKGHHPLLVANCLAQSQALMLGRTLEEAGGNPHRVFAGDRPSLTILYRKLDPFTLGRLIALYEHRVFVEAAIWGINAFDQWGVELGKELATRLELPVTTGQGLDGLDSSTVGLIRRLRGE